MFTKENMLFVKNTGIKKIFLISLFFLSWSCLMAKTYYVAPPTATPAGNDNNPGTKDKPWATWGKAFNSGSWGTTPAVNPGDTVYFRGGIYYKNLSAENDWFFYPNVSEGGTGYEISRDGTAGNLIKYWAYPDDVANGNYPILDCYNAYSTVYTRSSSRYCWGIYSEDVNYVHLKGLRVRNVRQVMPHTISAFGIQITGNGTIIENCVSYNIWGTGFRVGGGTGGTINIMNCDAHHCCDSLSTELPGNDGYGFVVQDVGGSAYFNGCRAWNCGDDGYMALNSYEIFNDQYVEYNNCWSFRNGMLQGGGSGFKMGWIAYTNGNLKRTYTNCIAAYNRWNGWKTNDYYSNTAAIFSNIYNCTAYHNGWQGGVEYVSGGFEIHNVPTDKDENELKRNLRNNIAYDNEGKAVRLGNGALYSHDHNSWDIPITLTNNDFVSLDSTGISGPRKPDGSLPDLNGFLKLKAGSKAIDAGVDVGLPYFGKAPDLGAYEYKPEEIINQYPVISITSPESGDVFTTPVNITITTNASDPDGNIAKVEFFNGSVKIGEKTSAPWSFTWSNVPEGTYNISAVATDNLNAKTPSAAVKITVNQAPRVTNQAPSVSIVKPVAGAVFTSPATITISADATDNDGLISKVEFFHGTTKLGEKSSSPWTFNWNNVPSGSYSLTARATDNSGSKTTSSAVNITVRAYPVISITSPVSGSSFTAPANITIAANASNPDGSITKVEFFNGTSSIISLSAAPWTFTWNNVAAGTYSLTAVATDNSGLKTTSIPITLTVKDSPPPVTNHPPVISILDIRPETSFFAPAKITISATATDPDGSVSSVEFFNKTTSLGVITSAPWSIVWNDVPEGNYSITAVATDNLGAKTTSSAVSLTIYKKPNQPPLVSIVSPVNGQIFKKNDEIMINVAASDPDGSIERIEIYDGSKFLAEISSSPYTYSWKYAEKGIHTLSAVAIDNLNESTVSSQVSIEVKVAQIKTVKNKDILNLYPNPNDGNFTVAFSSSAAPEGLGVIDIVSAEGKSITRKIVGNENTTMTFNLSHIKSGLYILIYKNKGKIIATKKFFKY